MRKTLKDLLGDKYRENMTAQEIEEALSEIDGNEDNNDGDGNEDNNGDSGTQAPKGPTVPEEKTVSKKQFDSALHELSMLKKQLKAEQTKGMSAEQLLEEQKKEFEEEKRVFSVSKNRSDIEKMFVKNGIDENTYSSILDEIVTDDSDKSTAVAESIISMLNTQKESVAKQVKDDMLHSTPKPPASGAKGTEKTGKITVPTNKKELSTLSPMERAKFSEEHPEEYKNIYQQEE